METVILGLGSNQGSCLKILKSAANCLAEIMSDCKISSFYLSKPQGFVKQADFINAVFAGSYSGTPEKLLKEIHAIEKAHGRDRTAVVPKGPRTLDIDILFFGSRKRTAKKLTLPHPEIQNRQFVLIPLLELFPDFIDPETGVLFKDISAKLGDQGVTLMNY